MEFQDKVVLITGAGRGTGRQMAESFAAQGARVAVNDISPQNLESLVAELHRRGYNAKPYVEDIAKKMTVQALVKQVEDDFGRIDVLINHASVEPHTSLLDMDEWDWQRTIDVNLNGAFFVMQSVGRIMRERGDGVIINIASLSGGTVLLDRAAYVACLAWLASRARRHANSSPTASASMRWDAGWGVSRIPAPPSPRICLARYCSCAVRAHRT
jgi:NAD(P)-dependent dehydrogenase (short-subunit alcohol dehydrogenase family)